MSVEQVDDGFEHLFPTPEQEAAERAIVAAEVAEIRAILDSSAPADWPGYLDVLGDDDVSEPVLPSLEDQVADLAAQGSDGIALQILESVDPAALEDPLDRLHYLRALDRAEAYIAAKRVVALAALAGPVPSGAYLTEVHVEHEVAVARRTSRYSAGRAIETARALVTDFPSFRSALAKGEISQAHCSILVDRTRVLDDPALRARIEARVLAKARRLAPGEFAREVTKAVLRVDPAGAADRHRRAKETRRVTARPVEDGMGYLGVVDDWVTISAIHQTLTSDARALQLQRGGAPAAADDGDALLDSCRADALAARVLGTLDADGTISWERETVPVTGQLVIDLDTLRGEADHPCLLDGQPIPAAVGRELARGIESWRRMVTDPVTGHLLDYGRETYLPAPLRRYIGARDGGCRAPGCGTTNPARLQLDHADPFPDGPSDTANTGDLCASPCHQLKTAGHVDIVDGRADGSCTWVTAWGQRVQIPPRPFLIDPADLEPPPEPPPPPEVPPF